MSAGGSLSAAQRLREHSSEVIEQLRAGYYLDELYAKKVFSEEDRDDVKALEKKRKEQARKFIDIIATKGEDKIRTFFEVLRTAPEDKQPHLYKLFFPDAEEHERNGSTGQTGTPAGTGSTRPTVNRAGSDAEVTTNQVDEMSRPSTHTDPRRDASRSSKEGKSTSTIAAGELDEDAVVTPKQMKRLSKEVGSNWHDIGLNLDVTVQELENIELQQKSLDGRLFQVLTVWSKEKGDQAKVGVLMDACKEAKVGGAAMRALRDQ